MPPGEDFLTAPEDMGVSTGWEGKLDAVVPYGGLSNRGLSKSLLPEARVKSYLAIQPNDIL